MSASPTSHSQSGFMSVESIGNALFYLIMLGIAALVVSVVMNTGKGGGDLSAISMVRTNVQYYGSNAGNYLNAASIILSNTTPLVSSANKLPSGNGISVATYTGSSDSQFGITLSNYDADMCRKYAYYGIGSDFEKVTIGTTTTVTLNSGNIETECNKSPLLTPIVLVSR